MMPRKIADCAMFKWKDGDNGPLHFHFRKRILELIADGRLQVGDMLPSRNRLREVLGISSTPYHKVINELIHDGVLRASKGKGVFVQSRQGRHAPEHVITLLVSEPETLEHMAFSEVVNGILDEIVPRDFSLKFTFFRPFSSNPEEITAKLQTLHCEGVIIPFCAEMRPEQLVGLRNLGVPAVFLGKAFPEISPLVVETDSRKGFSDYVSSLGKKTLSVAYIGAPQENFYERHAAWFRDACGKHHVKLVSLEHCRCDFSQQGGSEATERLLAGGVLPALIVAEDDYVACGVLSALARHGKAQPLVTVGGFLKHLYPLSEYPAIDLNYRKTGRAAALLLLSAVNGTLKEECVAVESEFYK